MRQVRLEFLAGAVSNQGENRILTPDFSVQAVYSKQRSCEQRTSPSSVQSSASDFLDKANHSVNPLKEIGEVKLLIGCMVPVIGQTESEENRGYFQQVNKL